ncbi:uncharacterized protein ColSpa_10442 [Colletotrichum spaethianum]|uniref:Uncharacterized protein n=1 Tax=Colletotrichum spaethianum TaxID=700344 RepID=A0AA37PDJ5_9PEZI|nr:uncharacterized protein ColSpa_10442 [Colletotrichum spaethianum]GKT50261.1 hypothetical protein ColSpa_10442 [Colletotrichum spaethianum]
MYPGPKPPTPHVPGIYRFTATALGAGMWFFLMYRAKKDGSFCSIPDRAVTIVDMLTDHTQDPCCWAGSTLGTTE